ncbi:MAG: hypothetical protein R2757_01515 [Draconibacterium sp.]
MINYISDNPDFYFYLVSPILSNTGHHLVLGSDSYAFNEGLNIILFDFENLKKQRDNKQDSSFIDCALWRFEMKNDTDLYLVNKNCGLVIGLKDHDAINNQPLNQFDKEDQINQGEKDKSIFSFLHNPFEEHILWYIDLGGNNVNMSDAAQIKDQNGNPILFPLVHFRNKADKNNSLLLGAKSYPTEGGIATLQNPMLIKGTSSNIPQQSWLIIREDEIDNTLTINFSNNQIQEVLSFGMSDLSIQIAQAGLLGVPVLGGPLSSLLGLGVSIFKNEDNHLNEFINSVAIAVHKKLAEIDIQGITDDIHKNFRDYRDWLTEQSTNPGTTDENLNFLRNIQSDLLNNCDKLLNYRELGIPFVLVGISLWITIVESELAISLSQYQNRKQDLVNAKQGVEDELGLYKSETRASSISFGRHHFKQIEQVIDNFKPNGTENSGKLQYKLGEKGDKERKTFIDSYLNEMTTYAAESDLGYPTRVIEYWQLVLIQWESNYNKDNGLSS